MPIRYHFVRAPRERIVSALETMGAVVGGEGKSHRAVHGWLELGQDDAMATALVQQLRTGGPVDHFIGTASVSERGDDIDLTAEWMCRSFDGAKRRQKVRSAFDLSQTRPANFEGNHDGIVSEYFYDTCMDPLAEQSGDLEGELVVAAPDTWRPVAPSGVGGPLVRLIGANGEEALDTSALHVKLLVAEAWVEAEPPNLERWSVRLRRRHGLSDADGPDHPAWEAYKTDFERRTAPERSACPDYGVFAYKFEEPGTWVLSDSEAKAMTTAGFPCSGGDRIVVQ